MDMADCAPDILGRWKLGRGAFDYGRKASSLQHSGSIADRLADDTTVVIDIYDIQIVDMAVLLVQRAVKIDEE